MGWSNLPTTLADAMAVQAYEWAEGRVNIKACKQCGDWFEFGPGSSSGYNSKRDYCSDKCRVAWHRAN